VLSNTDMLSPLEMFGLFGIGQAGQGQRNGAVHWRVALDQERLTPAKAWEKGSI